MVRGKEVGARGNFFRAAGVGQLSVKNGYSMKLKDLAFFWQSGAAFAEKSDEPGIPIKNGK